LGKKCTPDKILATPMLVTRITNKPNCVGGWLARGFDVALNDCALVNPALLALVPDRETDVYR